MSDIAVPIEIKQGSTWKMLITLKTSSAPLFIQNYTFEGSIKQTVYDEIEYPFTFTPVDVVNGKVMAIMEPSVSSQMDFKKGVYNMKYIASETEQYRFLEGPVTISLEV